MGFIWNHIFKHTIKSEIANIAETSLKGHNSVRMDTKHVMYFSLCTQKIDKSINIIKGMIYMYMKTLN